jgi:hypothetical protein
MQTHERLRFLVALPALAVFCAAPAFGYDQTFLAASICNDYFYDTQRVFFGWWGEAYVPGAGNGSVVCGIGQDTVTDTNDTVKVFFADQNQTTGQNIICRVFELSYDGSYLEVSGFLYGCPNNPNGGCTYDPGSYAGSGYLQFLNIRHGGGEYSSAVQCGIPPAVGSSYSGITSIFLDNI